MPESLEEFKCKDALNFKRLRKCQAEQFNQQGGISLYVQ